MRKSFIEKFSEECNKKEVWTLNRKICLIFSILIMVVLIFTGCAKENDVYNEAEDNSVAELPQDTINVGDDGVSAAIAPDNTANKSMVSLSVEDIGRADPFLPYDSSSATVLGTATKSSGNYDLLPPPQSITVDTEAKEVISTKVSGIMYDRSNPSAIIKIADTDYLVRAGDVINGYKVLAISKDIVTVQHGANIYKAGVGELFTDGELNFNTISNLESKFGGLKNRSGK